MAAPPVWTQGPPGTKSSPLLLNSAEDLSIVCGNRKDIASQLACVSWINGASQINARFRSLNPVLFPDFCPPAQGHSLGREQDVLLA